MENKKLTQKQEKATITDQAFIHIVEPADFSQGPEGSSYKFKASNLNLAGQDNIDIRKYVTISSNDTNTEILAKINALPQYTINEKQSVWFISRQRGFALPADPLTPVPVWEPQRILKYKMLNKGKGIYGNGGVQLTSSDIELIYDNAETTEDIENDPTTDVVNFGTLSGQNISQWLNSQNPAIVIQSQDDGYTLFKGIENGTFVTYLWIGEPGVYGVGESSSVITDFQALSNTPPSGLDQNNILAWLNFGDVIDGTGYITSENVSDWLNSQPYSISITEKTTPVVFLFNRFIGETNYRFIFVYSRGKGIWGKANGAVTDISKWFYAVNIKFWDATPITVDDIESDPYAQIHDLGTINDGDYITVANEATTWDFTDSGSGEPGQTISHYFSYEENGVTKIVKFIGTPGYYGVDETQFVEADFSPVTNGNITPQIEITGNIVDNTDPTTPNISIFTDDSLYFDEETRLISANVSTYTETYTWETGNPQEWTLDFEPTKFIYVSVNGQILPIQGVQWQYTTPYTLTILETLNDEDVVHICYEHYLIQP